MVVAKPETMTDPSARIGLLLSDRSNYSEIRKALKGLENAEEVFTSYKFENLPVLAKEHDAQIVLVSDELLSNHNFQKLGELAQDVQVIIYIESNENYFPAAFLAFHLLHRKNLKPMLGAMIEFIALGGHGYDLTVRNGFHIHQQDLSSPSDYGLTPRHIEFLNGHLSSKTQEEVAQDLGVSVETVKTTLKTIRKKLGLLSFSEFIPFLRSKHWCHFESGEIIWF